MRLWFCHLLRKEEREYIGIGHLKQQTKYHRWKYDRWKLTYSCQNKSNKLVDSLKQNLKKSKINILFYKTELIYIYKF